jgi:hypothetical protein
LRKFGVFDLISSISLSRATGGAGPVPARFKTPKKKNLPAQESLSASAVAQLHERKRAIEEQEAFLTSPAAKSLFDITQYG